MCRYNGLRVLLLLVLPKRTGHSFATALTCAWRSAGPKLWQANVLAPAGQPGEGIHVNMCMRVGFEPK